MSTDWVDQLVLWPHCPTTSWWKSRRARGFGSMYWSKGCTSSPSSSSSSSSIGWLADCGPTQLGCTLVCAGVCVHVEELHICSDLQTKSSPKCFDAFHPKELTMMSRYGLIVSITCRFFEVSSDLRAIINVNPPPPPVISASSECRKCGCRKSSKPNLLLVLSGMKVWAQILTWSQIAV